jgi:hypothetical protein
MTPKGSTMQELKIRTITEDGDKKTEEIVRYSQPKNIVVTADMRGSDIYTSTYLLGGDDEDIDSRRFDIDWADVNIITNVKNARSIAEAILERIKAVEA